jgi:RHS repeat-associated protein
LDSSSGLYHYGARYYDAAIGRFVQPDTVVPEPGNPQALNRYSYTLNNPLRYTDPTGHFTEEELLEYGISKEQIQEWKQDPAWWAIIEEARLGDVVRGRSTIRGVNVVYQAIFHHAWVSDRPESLFLLEDRGFLGYRAKGIEQFRRGTKDYELWRVDPETSQLMSSDPGK